MDVLAVVRILGHETCAMQEPPDAEPEGRRCRGFAGAVWGLVARSLESRRAGRAQHLRCPPAVARQGHFFLCELC